MIQDIYDYLIKAGLTHDGALGLMGNLMAESGCEACRLQGDFELSRSRSKAYAEKVDSGEMSVHIFSRDGQGWGLPQFTYFKRKEGLFYYCKGKGKSIADENAQLGYILKELREEYFSLLQYLCKTTEMYTSCKRVCEEYERPAVNNVQARYAMAQSIEQELKKADKPKETECYWPPRVVDKNMVGADVMVLQAVLSARGYYKGDINGRFQDQTEAAVKNFQRDNGLVVDGVVGKMTWSKALSLQ